jgi:hypothetical protein
MLSGVVKTVGRLSSPVVAVLAAKAIRTFCYGFLGITLPIYLADLGMGATGVGAAGAPPSGTDRGSP